MLVSESLSILMLTAIFDNNNIFILLYLKWKLTASFPLSRFQVDTVAETTRLKKLAAKKQTYVCVSNMVTPSTLATVQSSRFCYLLI